MWIFVLLALLAAVALCYAGRTWLGWVVPVALLLAGWAVEAGGPTGAWWAVAVPVAAVAVVTGVRPLRRAAVTRFVLPAVRRILPRMSETERIALDAGTVWYEAELFSGDPDWQRLHAFEPRTLSPREQAFLDGPVERACAMVDDHEVVRRGDLPDEVWRFLADEGFFGMIVPEEHGGLGFSAAAHSAVVTKLSSRSVALAVTVMVPNSLGPAELLLHYGTPEQRERYLPRLARGEEIPCFALTEPRAGSDAGGMSSVGVVRRGTWEGRETLGIELEWDKRYITLAPVATLIGLAFVLKDPEGLLGGDEDVGITCALVPADLPGVEIGERHDPLGVPFMNGPTRGRGVFVPLDAVIGGRAGVGEGWRMLMQTLAAGRGISLPSMACGASQLVTRVVGAYATVREQFGLAIGRFEGVQEAIARVGGSNYMMNAARTLTVGAVDAGEKPSVASAIVKCWLSEAMRDVTNDGMDVVGGAGICRGPRNVLANGYAALPIGITVEGANILTRTMIVFGQGAIRCHPFVQDELRGAETGDLELFDRAFFGHVGFVSTNAARALVLGLADGRLARTPGGPLAHVYRRLTRLSSAYALVSDVAMGTLGGTLKRKEMITGRLADGLAWLYLGAATLHRFRAEGERPEHLDLARWAGETAVHEVQRALDGVLRNLPSRPAALLLRPLVFPLGRRLVPPGDRLTQRVARALLDGGAAREDTTRECHVPPPDELGLGQLEDALAKVVRARPVLERVKEAVASGRLEKRPTATLVRRALDAGVLGPDDEAVLADAEAARERAIAVDAFAKRELLAELSA